MCNIKLLAIPRPNEKKFKAPSSKIFVYGSEGYDFLKSICNNDIIKLSDEPIIHTDYSMWYLKLKAIKEALIRFNSEILYLDFDSIYIKSPDDTFYNFFIMYCNFIIFI